MKKLVLLASVLAVAASPAFAATKLSADDIKAKVIGHTLSWKTDTASGVTTYNTDGTAEFKVGDKTEKGTWSITKKGKLCGKIGTAKPSCSGVQQVDDKTFTFPALKSTAVIQ